EWAPDFIMSDHPQYMAPPRYGLTHFKDLFTNRQLYSLTTISDLIHEWHKENVGKFDQDYLNLLTLYLFFAVDRLVDYNCNVTTWLNTSEQQKHLFTANRISMSWDYPEGNILLDKAICWKNSVKYTAEAIQ